MIIRLMRGADIDDVFAVRTAVKVNHMTEAELAGVGITRATVDAGIANGEMIGWCAVAGSALIGFSLVFVADREVNALFVHPDHEHRGAGSMLLTAAVDWLRERGSEPITLRTDPQTPAFEFYRRRGWRDTGRDQGGDRVMEYG